jgi:hypothetical protein
LYLIHIHSGISFTVGLGARYRQTPHESHWKVTKGIFLYFWGIVQFHINCSSGGTPLLLGFADPDWVGDPDGRKSIVGVGYVFSLGFRPVTWACKKQRALVLSSAEAEYRVVVSASQEDLWLRQILSEFGFQ